MFRRNFFSKGSGSTTQSKDNFHPTIPEDEQVPSTPIPERLTLFTSDSWQDPKEPKSASWTSQAAAYDINPKYTTANQSYTHRRRKSSVITDLIGNNDPYQPTYQDWREGVASPESLRPRHKSWSLFGSRKGRHFGIESHGKHRCGKVTKIIAALFLLVSVAFSGLWLFGGPMPLLTVDHLQALDWRLNGSSLQWSGYHIDLKGLERGTWRDRMHQVRRWIPSAMRRDDHSGSAGDSASASQTSPTMAQISISINPDLLSFGVQTLETKTRKVSSTAASVSAQSTGESLTVLGDPTSSNEVGSAQSTGMSAVQETVEVEADDVGTAAHRKRSQDMWKKYAETSEDGTTISFAGAMADAAPSATKPSIV